ncbi:hypothetical protein ACO1O0_005265 [Amphichorda felina]
MDGIIHFQEESGGPEDYVHHYPVEPHIFNYLDGTYRREDGPEYEEDFDSDGEWDFYSRKNWLDEEILPLYQLPHLNPCCIACNTTQGLTPCPNCQLVFACEQHSGPAAFEPHRAACWELSEAKSRLREREDLLQTLTGSHPRDILFDGKGWTEIAVAGGQQTRGMMKELRWSLERLCLEYRRAMRNIQSGVAVKQALEGTFSDYAQGLFRYVPGYDRSIFLWLFIREDCDNMCFAFTIASVVGLGYDDPLELDFRPEDCISDYALFRRISTRPYDFLAEPRRIPLRAVYHQSEHRRHDLLFLQLLLKLRTAARVRNMQAAYQLLFKGLPLELVTQIQVELAPDLVDPAPDLGGRSRAFRTSVRYGEDLTKYVQILEGQARAVLENTFEHSRMHYFWPSFFIPSMQALGKEDRILYKTYHKLLSQVPHALDLIREACVEKYPWFEAVALHGGFPDTGHGWPRVRSDANMARFTGASVRREFPISLAHAGDGVLRWNAFQPRCLGVHTDGRFLNINGLRGRVVCRITQSTE